MAVITISRQYGSGGDEIAARLCELLGYRYFDKKMMAQVAAETGLSDTEVVDFSEQSYKVRSFLDRLLGRGAPVTQVSSWKEDRAGVRAVELQSLDEKQSIAMVRGTIQAACKQGKVVIVGRGAQVVLRDVPGTLHVRVEAPEEVRLKRVQETQALSREAARELTVERDRAAAAYVKRFYDLDWADPMQYHLLLNTGRWDVEAAAQIVVNALNYLPG